MAAWTYKIYLQVLKKYFTSEHSEQAKYFSTQEEIFYISKQIVIFFVLYKIFTTHNNAFGNFRRFPTTFQRFPKIFQNLSEGQMNVSKHFPKISKHFP